MNRTNMTGSEWHKSPTLISVRLLETSSVSVDIMYNGESWEVEGGIIYLVKE